MTRRQAGNMDPTDRRFYSLGRIIAVLELGARAHGEIRWLHLYYAFGFLPHAGLREPLQKHNQSVLPRLKARGTAERYITALDRLARDLQEVSGVEDPAGAFDSWASQVLKERGYGEDSILPTNSTPADASAYAQGYLDQRRALQPKRPAPPPAEEAEGYSWQYHLGRP